MGKSSIHGTKLAHSLMVGVLFIWGGEYVAVKYAQISFPVGFLLFLKITIGLVFILVIKLIKDRGPFFHKKDIPLLIFCSFLGEILYYYTEYSAIQYAPVALVTMILALVPAVSLFIERFFLGNPITPKMILALILGLIGVALIIGVDMDILFQGRILGYLLGLGAVFAWNGYNFFTHGISQKYTILTLTTGQLLCSMILLLPVAIGQFHQVARVHSASLWGLLFIGILSSGVGFLIYVYGLKQLGPTVSAVYSNFLPITATLFGFLFLGESIEALQGLGGAVVIISGYVIIMEKAKTERISHD